MDVLLLRLGHGSCHIISGGDGVHVGSLATLELAQHLMPSRAPTSGGQYHWASEFAPPSVQKPISYLSGAYQADRLITRRGAADCAFRLVLYPCMADWHRERILHYGKSDSGLAAPQ